MKRTHPSSLDNQRLTLRPNPKQPQRRQGPVLTLVPNPPRTSFQCSKRSGSEGKTKGTGVSGAAEAFRHTAVRFPSGGWCPVFGSRPTSERVVGRPISNGSRPQIRQATPAVLVKSTCSKLRPSNGHVHIRCPRVRSRYPRHWPRPERVSMNRGWERSMAPALTCWTLPSGRISDMPERSSHTALASTSCVFHSKPSNTVLPHCTQGRWLTFHLCKPRIFAW